MEFCQQLWVREQGVRILGSDTAQRHPTLSVALTLINRGLLSQEK